MSASAYNARARLFGGGFILVVKKMELLWENHYKGGHEIKLPDAMFLTSGQSRAVVADVGEISVFHPGVGLG